MQKILESLHLINFELHQDTLLKFIPGINVIYGPSDQAKSSIRRALTWVASNRPVGPRCVKDDTKESSVAVCFTGVPTVTRGRKNDKNYYKIDGEKLHEEEVDPLKAFGYTVPEKVTEILGLSDVNIQEQFKEYYLLQKTPGQVAKIIHKLLGMDLIDKTATVINKAISWQTTLLKAREGELKNIKTDIKKYDYLKDLEADYNDLESLMHSYEKQDADVHNLTVLLDKCYILYQKIIAAKIPPGVEAEARALKKELQEIEIQQDKIDRLDQLLLRIAKTSKKIKDLDEWLLIEPEARALQKEIINIGTQEAKIKPLEDLIEQLAENHRLLKNVGNTITRAETNLEVLKKKLNLKECPFCKRPF